VKDKSFGKELLASCCHRESQRIKKGAVQDSTNDESVAIGWAKIIDDC
jgi:hypothetical protein